MDQLGNIRKHLKKWEGEFYKQHNRKPNKDDISCAPEEVKVAYKEYSVLKKRNQKADETVNDNSLESDLDRSKHEKICLNDNDIWGSHLNKAKCKESSSWLSEMENQNPDNDNVTKTKENEETEDVSGSFTTNLRQKLLAKAMLSSEQKINKPWSSPFMKKSKGSIFSANRSSVSKDDILVYTADNKSTNNFLQKVNDANTSKDDSDDDIEIKSSIFAKGLKATKKVNKPMLYEDESKMDNFVSVLQQRKINSQKLKTKYGNYHSANNVFNEHLKNDVNDGSSKSETQRNEAEKLSNACNTEVNRPFGMFSKGSLNCKEGNFSNNTIDQSVEGYSKSSDTTSCVQNETETIAKNIVPSVQNHDFNRKNATNCELKEAGMPELPKKGTKRKISVTDDKCAVSTPKRRNVLRKLKSPEEPVNEDSNSMMVEVSWRPTSRQEGLMIDLDSSTQDILSDEDQSDKESITNYKPKKYSNARSTASKMSNENYVRLNMKAKKYQRKGKITSGPAYKRMQWKNKMRARSESFGSGKCFKCGQEGHWAKNCKGAMSKPNTTMINSSVCENTVDDADFPSMSQAFNMARGIKSKTDSTTPRVQPTKSYQAKTVSQDNDETTNQVDEEDNFDLDEEPDVIRTAYEVAPPPPAVEPLYQVQGQASLPEPTEEVFQALGKFGFTSFRQGQQKAIMRVLCGQSTLVVLSTGAGKSLCYQLPAFMYAQREPSIALVISPLVSLMEDQVSRLPPGVKGACLHTNMSPAQREKVTEDVASGKIHFLLISPEAMAGGKAGGCLPGINKMPPIAFACIDEAHCLSEWSHHFRPSYLRICKILREKFGVRCFLGLTATATMVTAASVAQHLGIHDYNDATIRGSPVPTNLQLSVSRDDDKDEALITLLQGERLAKCDSIIIYCTRREQTDRIATLIRTCMQEMKKDSGPKLDEEDSSSTKKTKGKKGGKAKKRLDAECYHAGMSAAQRKRVQNAFMSGRLWVVVATVAFGMGLDKPDVRAVIHYNLPKSFESYVQEIGRAGRDGKPAQCHLFLDSVKQDMNELKRHIYSNTVDRYVIKRLVHRVFPPCRCKELHERHTSALLCLQDCDDVNEGDTADDPVLNKDNNGKRICPDHERAVSIQSLIQSLDMKEEGIATLLCYLELHPKNWIENFQNVYGNCTIQCYGGPRQLQAIAKKCPPVAIAIAKEKKLGVSHSKSSKLEFPVVEISDSMGWESGPVKRELKLLQWNFDSEGIRGPSKSGVLVELSDLSFHLRSPGDLTDEEIDDIVCFLADRIETQERTELFQLQEFYNTLHRVSHKHVWMCSERVDADRSIKLKASVLEYFDRQPDIDENMITKLSFAREIGSNDTALINDKITCDKGDFVRGDIRAFIQLYSSEHQLTGRSIARVFHGIPSPCFPAEVWGKVRRFWRCHMDTDFNLVRKMATQELIKLR